MANGNPYYIQPAGDYSEGLKGLGAALIQGQELKRKREAQQKLEQLRGQAAEIFKTGDPDAIAEFSAANPEFSKALIDLTEHKSKQTEENYRDSLFEVYKNPSPENIKALVESRKRVLQSQGVAPEQSKETDTFEQRMMENPEKVYAEVEKELAAKYPKQFKGLRADAKKQKTGAFVVRDADGKTSIAVGVFDPDKGTLKTEKTAIGAEYLVSKLGETGTEESARKVLQKKGETQAIGEEKRAADLIERGVLAAESTATIRRGLELLDMVKTGGFAAANFAIKRTFGVEGANEGELSNSLGKAVLSQLRETFGAQFTEKEGRRLARLEAGFSKSTENNRRILTQVLRIAERTAKRALKAAKKRGDNETAEDIEELLQFSLSEPESFSSVSEMSDEELKKLAFATDGE